MRIEIGKYSGFCAGVKAAVEKAFTAAKGESPCWMLGPLIHNEKVMEQLEKAGIRIAQTVDEIGEGTVIIRSHGADPALIQKLKDRGNNVLDATCPNVSKVHRLVESRSADGRHVFIAGRKDHPEVQATAGWCKGPVTVLENEKAALEVTGIQSATLVAQTTLTVRLWEEILAALRSRIPDLDAYCTICKATEERQLETESLARRADALLVVGDRTSANTKALYETGRRLCPRTYFIGSAAEVREIEFAASDYIAVAAGASTPDWLLKEVATLMNDLEQNVSLNPAEEQPAEPAAEVTAEETKTETAEPVENSFMADVEATLVTIRPGQTITGKVVQVTDDEIGVDIGYKADGIVKRSDLVNQDVKVDDEIEVEVVKVNDGEGNVLLSQRNIVNRRNWDALMEKYEANEYIDAVGKEAVKGGLIADAQGIRAFVPASQLARHYVEKIEEFVGKEMKLKIIEVDKQKRRIVCSRKAVLIEQAAAHKKEIWEKLSEGEIVDGIVRRLTDFGAFVDIGGVDGLVHVTDLSWGRVKHPSEIVSPNQPIKVKILSLDPERERIQLGYKQLQPKPWDVAEEKYPVGAIVEGKVVRITTFGAFVELEPGLDGLVHISQCALTRIAKVEDALQVGQVVHVKILGVDPEAKRISLSVRAALEEEAFNYSGDIPGEELTAPTETEEVPAEENVADSTTVEEAGASDAE